jgi:hypothetical protein
LKHSALLFILVLSQISPTYANVGAGSFLNRGVSARALGLGGAYVCMAEGPAATYWNPAGCVKAKGLNFQLSDLVDTQFFTEITDVNYPQIGITYSPLQPIWTYLSYGVGLGYYGFYVEDIEQYDSNANYLGKINYNESITILSFAIGIDNLQVGLSYKYHYQNFGIATQSSKLFQNMKGMDFGVRFRPIEMILLAITVQDQYETGEEDLSMQVLIAGLCLEFDRFFLEYDYQVVEQSFNRYSIGSEYKFGEHTEWSIRAGLKDIPVTNSYIDKQFIALNAKLGVGAGYSFLFKERKHGLIFDIGLQQEIRPSILKPLSRIVATTITLF